MHGTGEALVVGGIVMGIGLGGSMLVRLGRDMLRRKRADKQQAFLDQARREREAQRPPITRPDIPVVEPEHPVRVYQDPLTVWRKNDMHKITDIPTALLRNGAPVVEGDILPINGEASGRQVKILNPVPDPDGGGILVQENYLADASALGCTIREESVVLELPKAEALALIKYFQEQTGGPAGEETVGEETRQFARPVFQDLRDTLLKKP